MNRQAWLEWRRKGIGASDAPVIMGVNKNKTIIELMEEKIFGFKEEKTNEDIERGNRLEPIALAVFMKETGIILDDVELKDKCIIHPKNNWMRATLDGLNKKKKIFVEAKAPRKLHSVFPDIYYPQNQHQYECSDYEKCFCIELIEKREGDERNDLSNYEHKIFEVARNQGYIEFMKEKEKEVWDAILSVDFAKFESHLDKTTCDHWRSLAIEYIEVKSSIKSMKKNHEKELKDLEEKRDFLEKEFILWVDGKSSRGHGVQLTRYMTKGQIEYEKIPELKDVNTDKYRKSPSAKFRFTP